jgi:hypothetical protein
MSRSGTLLLVRGVVNLLFDLANYVMILTKRILERV